MHSFFVLLFCFSFPPPLKNMQSQRLSKLTYDAGYKNNNCPLDYSYCDLIVDLHFLTLRFLSVIRARREIRQKIKHLLLSNPDQLVSSLSSRSQPHFLACTFLFDASIQVMLRALNVNEGTASDCRTCSASMLQDLIMINKSQI